MTDSLRTDLNDFLFTPIANDAKGMHVTMLSALARSGVDPWMEAAELASLSREDATQRLEQLLADVPDGPSPGENTATLAARLVAQLHAPPKARLKPVSSSADSPHGEELPALSFLALPKRARLAIYSLLALILMVTSCRALMSSESIISDDIGLQQSH